MKWLPIVLAYASLFILGGIDNIRGPLFPSMLAEMKISDFAGSWFFAVAALLAFGGGFGCRFTVKRIGLYLHLRLALLTLSVSVALIGLGHQFWIMMVGSAGLGLSMGVIGVVQNLLIIQGSTPGNMRRLLSGLHSMYGMASLLAPIVVAGLFKFNVPWRWAFGGFSVLPLLLVPFTFILDLKPITDNKEGLVAGPNKKWLPAVFCVMLGSYVACEIMVSSRLALYMLRVYGKTEQQSSLYVAFFFLFLFLGRSLFASIPVVFSNRNMLIYSALLSVVTILCGLLWHPLFLGVSAFFMAPFFPVALAYAYELFASGSEKVISLAISLMSLFVLLMHGLIGLISDHYSIHVAYFTCLPIFTVVLTCLWLLKSKPQPILVSGA